MSNPVTYLCSDHHVLNDVVHMRNQGGNVSIQEHNKGSTYILADIWVIIHGQMEQILLGEVKNV